MTDKTSFVDRFKSNWASLCALGTSLLGVICFAALISGSFESTETPAAVIGMAIACALLCTICFVWKDMFHALSVAAFFTSLGTLGAFIAGRVSYLAFYLSGDVMGTGLSPLFILSAILFVLTVVLVSLSMAQPFDGESRVKAGKYLIIAVVAIAVIALVVVAVIRAILGSSTPGPGGNNPTGSTPPVTSSQEPGQPGVESNAPSRYKTPTQDASHWQGLSAEELAVEDVSGKAIAYQFTGHEESNRVVDLLINLYEDGFVRISQVSGGVLTYDYNGYWRNKDDESIYFGVSSYVYKGEDNPSYNVSYGDTATVDYSYDLTEQNGIFSFGCNFCLGFQDGGQFVRSTIIEGNGSVTYATVDEFLTAMGATPPAEPTDPPEEPGETYPANTMLLNFTPDTSDQLNTTFSCESSVWGPALGASGSYTPTGSTDVLFSWSNPAESFQLDFHADGTYEYRFTTMNITENGTWTFESWKLTTTTAKGLTATAEITGSAEPSEPENTYPANTMLLNFTPDTSDQLNTTFSCESSVWGPALGASGNYTPIDSTNVLFSWGNPAESFQLDFHADGTYEYRFTTMNITEGGTWTFESWKLTTTTAKGLTATAEITK